MVCQESFLKEWGLWHTQKENFAKLWVLFDKVGENSSLAGEGIIRSLCL